jgi:hypothetical protein
MSSLRVGLRIAAAIFGIVCLVHLWRVLAHVPIRIGNYDVPQWPSIVAVIGLAILCLWLTRLSARHD